VMIGGRCILDNIRSAWSASMDACTKETLIKEVIV
jgi:hypothetical protein